MFDSAKQKIDRANYHISDIERQFAAFVAEKPHRFSVKSDPETGELKIGVRYVKDVPPALALTIGDAIHNLRCALDHMAWEAVGWNGVQDRYVKFPTGADRVSFEAACKGIKTSDIWLIDAFIALRAFPGGMRPGDRLYEIHLLDNADKHTVIGQVLRATSHPAFKVINPRGAGSIHMQGNVFATGLGPGSWLGIGKFPAGSAVELDDDAECPPSIFLEKPSNGRFVPTIDFLRSCRASVLEAMAKIEAAKPK